MVCKVRKYKTLLFMKNKGSSQIQMLPSEIVNSNIKLLYLRSLEAQAKPHTTQVEVQVFYEAFHVLLNPLESYAVVSNQSRLAIASHHQTVAIMASYNSILCELCGDEVYEGKPNSSPHEVRGAE